MWCLSRVTVICAVAWIIDAQDYLDVPLEQGLVRGFRSPDEQRYEFFGIPYATVPQGAQRYKAPLAPPSWDGIFVANNHDVSCPQVNITDAYLGNSDVGYYGTEDCLVVHVFLPANVQTSDSRPILALIHGGAFGFGSGNIDAHDISRFMSQNVIIVSFNYRLGALGFLCLGTETVPGNAGLKDQVAALRWVKDNIARFGGDPDDLTVYGGSAGSASLELLVLSQATEGLFNKAILESGSAISSWNVGYDPIGTAKFAADLMGFPDVNDLDVLAEIFLNGTAEELARTVGHFAMILTDTTFGFSPCIERRSDDINILTDSPINVIRSGTYNRVPLMVVYSDLEGVFRLQDWYMGWNTIFETRVADLLPPNLSFENDQQKVEVAQAAKEFYITNTDSELDAFIDFMTDIMFACSIIHSSVLHAENSVPVYLMEFSFHDQYSFMPGATHGDFFGHVLNARPIGQANEEVAELGTTMIINFMLNNNPIPNTNELLPLSWPTVTPTAVNYLAFNDQLTVRQSPIAERYQLWQNIYETHYRELPIPDNLADFMDISLDQGIVRGRLSQDNLNYRFTGIPYADPRTGSDRFKAAPFAPPSWSGIMEANSDVWCSQVSLEGQFVGTEDCLVVNVYLPVGIQLSDSLPVLAINHGGAYVIGSGSLDNFNINHPMAENLIIVSYNYRVGAYGFLCLGTENVPGNAGLKDQVAALRWIKSNIARFGGDPNDVTVFGNSAGSGSLELLVLSEAAQGLFNRVILESGSALNSWNVAYDPIGTAKSAAELLGFPNVDDLEELSEIFINATSEQLTAITLQMFNTLTDTTFGFSPCIERISDNFAILLDSPRNIIKSGRYNQVPMMVIYADMEGLLRLPQWFTGWNTIFEESFSDFLPPDLSFESDEQRFEVAESIKQFYVDYTEDDLNAYLYFMTDVMFVHSIIHSSVLHAENSIPVYLMEFSYNNEYSPFPGAGHGDFFTAFFNVRQYGPVNEQVAERAKMMIVNFIKYNNPVPSTSDLLPVSWPTVTPAEINYLAFNDQLTVRQSPVAERYHLWRSIYEVHYQGLPVPGNDVDYLEISMKQGTVRGYRSQDGQSFRFFGIPYADAPVGRDRFKAPLPPPSWTGILNATDSNIRCLQTHYGGITEDCLVINVYIPAGLAINASVPVLAMTHGGGFIYGSGTQDLLEINRLMAEEIVLVSYNYRLGVLGFLCLGTETAPGNTGLKDQVAALRWINNNIASFGGNPNDVTVFGYSAGSASLELLAISDATEGLFNRVILESGSAIGSWAVAYDPIGMAKSAANLMGFPGVENLNTLEEIFINATPEELAFAALDLQDSLLDITVGFGPCVEKILDNTTVLAVAPLDIISSNNYNALPVMAIYSDKESSMRIANWEAGWNETFAENFADFLPPHLSFENDEEKVQIAEEIKKFYIDNTENELLAFVDFLTDIMFAYSIIHSSVLHSENSDSVFLMEFSFHDEHNPLPGASHIDFFGHIFNARLQGPANDQVAEIATKMIVNFMRHDNPVPSTSDLLPVSWPTVTPTAVNYLAFNDQLAARQSPIAERYQLWKAIYETHYKEMPQPDPNSGLVVRNCGLTSFIFIVGLMIVNRIYI